MTLADISAAATSAMVRVQDLRRQLHNREEALLRGSGRAKAQHEWAQAQRRLAERIWAHEPHAYGEVGPCRCRRAHAKLILQATGGWLAAAGPVKANGVNVLVYKCRIHPWAPAIRQGDRCLDCIAGK